MNDNNFDNAPCLYFSCTNDGTIIRVNETLCYALGFTKQELENKKLDVIFPIATRIFYQTHFFPLLKMQAFAEEIYVSLQTKNKEELPVLLNAKTVDEKFIHTGIIVRNRKKFEDELIAAKKIAENALQQNTALIQIKQQLQNHAEELDRQMQMVYNQNEELRQFNHVVTHDLQEPLRKLSVFANLFLSNPERKDRQQVAEKILNASEKMRAVITGLQQYVWLTEAKLSINAINLNTIIAQAKRKLISEFPTIEFILYENELPAISADKEQMEMLFYQLFSNAIHYKKPGDKVYVTVTADMIKRNKFKNVANRYEYINFLKLQVKDEGTGFDAKYSEQAFDLFRRLHTVGGGLGIGLSLCKKIAENHEGFIEIDSAENIGTTITVLIPFEHA